MYRSTAYAEDDRDRERTETTVPAGWSRRDVLVNLCLIAGFFTLSWGLVRYGAWTYASAGGINLTLSDMFLLVVLLLLLGRGQLNASPFGATTPVWFLGFLLFIGGLLASTLVNGDPLRWLSVGGQYVFALLAIPMMLASFHRELLDRCMVAFVIGVALSQAVTFVASFFVDYHDVWEFMGMDFITVRGRIGALSGNANINGAMNTFGLLMALYAARRSLMPKWLLLPCAGFLVWGIIASASFTAFSLAAIAVPLFCLIVWPRNTILFGVPALVLVIGLLASGIPLPGAFEERVAEALTSGDIEEAGTFAGRWQLAIEAWRLSGGTLLFGYGADGYKEISAYGAPVHVFPLLVLTEGGLVSLVGLVVMILLLWAIGASLLKQDRVDSALTLGLLVVFTGFAFSAPHMYARLWIGPIMLAMLHGFAPRIESFARQGTRRAEPLPVPAAGHQLA
ncbi:hypothetical protein K3172_08075 [Qipengyuania sp. 6B39]|uniref:hypothetical protein n=1 Tax=Qipengyuania proteolytica TaxID=2867239 RepID=UPI001C8A5306|nr:hypothetical protein [Qipengyuania proteolytica]MBX7495812.1 hypothetical protein [Qipengyuania proteolytica]